VYPSMGKEFLVGAKFNLVRPRVTIGISTNKYNAWET
jgi:hypothetical protein